MNPHLLPEEDAVEDPDDDSEIDPTLPGDLWFRFGFPAGREIMPVGRGPGRIVYSRAFAPPEPRKCATG